MRPLPAIALALTSACASVQLSGAPVRPSFTAREQVTIALKLTNTGRADTAVSPRVDGTLRIVSLTHDGAPVKTRQSYTAYEEDLGVLLAASLKTIKPGESIDVIWHSVEDHVLGGQAFEQIAWRAGGKNELLAEWVGLPGKYELTVLYAYGAPGGNAYRKETNAITVQFTVTP